MYQCREIEHQELFFRQINPHAPVPIHIPSALGTLGYYLFVRVPKDAVARLASVASHLVVGGLRPDDVSVAPGEDAAECRTLPSQVDGLVWYCLGRAHVSRGDGTLDFQHWPTEIARVDLLLCTWPRFVESGQADDWLAGQDDPLWAPSGVPLGGIGAGRVDICRDGRFRNFSMNNNQDAPLENPDGLPGAYLSLTCHGRQIDLASRAVVPGHEACPQLAYTPRFPQAVLSAQEIYPGIDARVTLTGAICPQDLQRASLPGFLVRWELRNTSATAQTVQCHMGWPNLIGIGGGIATQESSIGFGDGGYQHWDDPTGRREEAIEAPDYREVRFQGTPADHLLASAGQHLLAAAIDGTDAVSTTLGDEHGEVTATITIPAHGTAQATMVFAAFMPHYIDVHGVDRGHYWENAYADGESILYVLLSDADAILRDSGALAELLADSTLPEWLQSRLSNCNYPLVTNSVLYRDGRFSINEGPTEMAGCLGTIDQRLAAHPATQLFFPQLNATELGLFARIQGANGGIQHDLGRQHLEAKPGEMSWPDLTCSFIIQTARHAWSTGDTAFETEMWPRARRALLRHVEWATAGHGVAQVGHGLGTSYDGYHYFGTTGYMATLWLAALAVMERWACRQGDAELAAQIPAWREAAIARMDEDLWNGRYYIAYCERDGEKRQTCHGGQLAGQVFAQLFAGTNVLPEERLDACIDAILALNGSDRYVVPPDEVGEDGEITPFGWLPYLEGFMLTAIAARGDERLWPLWQRMMAAVEADGKTPCDTRLMYCPVQGAQSWGSYYMTAPASWLVYDAWLDFIYEPADGVLRLRANAPGRYPLVHPLFWGTAEISEDGYATVTIRRVFADSDCAVRCLEMPAEGGGYRRVILPESVALREGAAVQWQFSAATTTLA